MDKHQLIDLIHQKSSFLCVGLDTDIDKIPPELAKKGTSGVLEFNKHIVEATLPYTVCYKINTAFYESLGEEGWEVMHQTFRLIPKDEALLIADAKRGDIGNTSFQYAKAFFHVLGADAITLSPYMGCDSIAPFLDYPGKWAIILCLTSNDGSSDFQMLELANGRRVFEEVLEKAKLWGTQNNIMFVVGATHPHGLRKVRSIVPNHFLLIPGVGAQGGDLQEVASQAMNDEVGILVNVSRSIIYASKHADYQKAALRATQLLHEQMKKTLDSRNG